MLLLSCTRLGNFDSLSQMSMSLFQPNNFLKNLHRLFLQHLHVFLHMLKNTTFGKNKQSILLGWWLFYYNILFLVFCTSYYAKYHYTNFFKHVWGYGLDGIE